MKALYSTVFLFLLATTGYSASLDSKFKHYGHDDEGQVAHNSDFDHEAFLGKDGAKEFESLSADESRRRLSLLVKKIDKDASGSVTEEELQAWVQGVHERYIQKDIDRQWLEFLGDADAAGLSFEVYKMKQYGADFDGTAAEDDETMLSYRKMQQRDVRRWQRADEEADGVLSKAQFAAFMHPEEFEHMTQLIALETIEEMDQDADGKLSLKEFIDDIWPKAEGSDDMPEWVQSEVELFRNFRDANSDGLLDEQEVQQWITPPDYDAHLAEARHLMHEADADKDSLLSEEEILQKHDVFVASQATDFGEALAKHDEF